MEEREEALCDKSVLLSSHTHICGLDVLFLHMTMCFETKSPVRTKAFFFLADTQTRRIKLLSPTQLPVHPGPIVLGLGVTFTASKARYRQFNMLHVCSVILENGLESWKIQGLSYTYPYQLTPL